MKKEIKQEVNSFSEFTDSLKTVSPFIFGLILGSYFCIYLLSKVNFELLTIASSLALFIFAIIIVWTKQQNQKLDFIKLISLGLLGGILIAVAGQIIVLQTWT
jgi:hypothetical protein